MKNNLLILFIPIFLFACTSTGKKITENDIARHANLATYEVVSEGIICKDSWTGSRVCNYDIGKDLKLRIKGVGRRVPRLLLFKSPGKKGDFYPSMSSPTTGCITIHRGKTGEQEKDRAALADLAFISMGDGGVYRSLEECRTSSESVSGWLLLE